MTSLGYHPRRSSARSLLLLARLVRRQVPRVDDPALGSIDLLLTLNVLDADLETVLGPDDVLLAHALRHVAAHLGCALVDMVAHEDEAGHNYEEYDQRYKLAAKGTEVSFRAMRRAKNGTLASGIELARASTGVVLALTSPRP